MTARGIRNNNPLNIRKSPDVFQGEIRPGSDKSFKQFRNPSYGYRAAFVILGTYLGRGLNTIEKIINAWAPETENNTKSYIDQVEKWSLVKRNKVLTSFDGEEYIKIVMAMCRVENGVFANPSDVRSGFNMQNKLKSRFL